MAFISTYHVILVSLLIFLDSTSARKLPSFINVCIRNSPQINECVQESMENIRPHLPNGIPDMHIPVLEPLHVMHAELDTGATFKAIFDNIRIYGLTNYTVKNVNVDFAKNTLDLELLFPHVQALADYQLKGRLLILQLNGYGKSDGSYYDLVTRISIKGNRFFKKGKEHVDFNKIKLDLHFGKNNSLTFENIFKGNKELTDQTNRIISENIEGIMAEIKPVFDDTVAQITLSILRGVFSRYSLNELFPVKDRRWTHHRDDVN